MQEIENLTTSAYAIVEAEDSLYYILKDGQRLSDKMDTLVKFMAMK